MADPLPKTRASWNVGRVANSVDATPPHSIRASWHVGTRLAVPEEFAIHTGSSKNSDIASVRSITEVGGMGLNWQDMAADIDENGSEASELYQDEGSYLNAIGHGGTETAALVRELLGGNSEKGFGKGFGVSSATSMSGHGRSSHSRKSNQSFGGRRAIMVHPPGIDDTAMLDVSEPSLSSTLAAPEWQDDEFKIPSASSSFISSPGPRSQHESVPPATSKWAAQPNATSRVTHLEAENAQLRLELSQVRQRAHKAEQALASLRMTSAQVTHQNGSRELNRHVDVSPQELLSRFENAALESQPIGSEVAHLCEKVQNLMRENERLESQEREVAKLHEWLQHAAPDTPSCNVAFMESMQENRTSSELVESHRDSLDDSFTKTRNDDSLTTIGESFADHSLIRGHFDFASPSQRKECVEICNSQFDANDVVMIRQEVLRLRIREQELIKSHERELAEFVFTLDSLREANQRLERHAEEDRLRGAAAAMLEEGRADVSSPCSEFEMFSEQRCHLEKIEATNKRLLGSEQAILTAIANLEEESKVLETRERELAVLHDAARCEIESQRAEAQVQQGRFAQELQSEVEIRSQALQQEVKNFQSELANMEAQISARRQDEFSVQPLKQEINKLRDELKEERQSTSALEQHLRAELQELALLDEETQMKDAASHNKAQESAIQDMFLPLENELEKARADLQYMEENSARQLEDGVADRLRDELKSLEECSRSSIQELLNAHGEFQKMESMEVSSLHQIIATQRSDNLKNEAELSASLAEMQSLQHDHDLELQSECQQHRIIVEEASAVQETLEKLTQDSLRMGSEEVVEFRRTVDALRSENARLTSLEQTTAELHRSLGSKNDMLQEQEQELARLVMALRAEASQSDFLRESLQSHEHDISVLQRSARELTSENLEIAPLQCEVTALHHSLQESMTICQSLDNGCAAVALQLSAITDGSTALNKVWKKQVRILSAALEGEESASAGEGHDRSLRSASSVENSNCNEFPTSSVSNCSSFAALEFQLGHLQSIFSESQCLQGELEEHCVSAYTRVHANSKVTAACRGLLEDAHCENRNLLTEMEIARHEHHEQLLRVVDRAHDDIGCRTLSEQERDITQLREEAVGSVRRELRSTQEELQQKTDEVERQTREMTEIGDSCRNMLQMQDRELQDSWQLCRTQAEELEELRESLSETAQRDGQRLAWSPIQNETHGETSCFSSSFPDRSLPDLGLNEARLEGSDGQLIEASRSCSPKKLVWEVLQALDVMQASLPEDIQTSNSIKSCAEQPSVTALHIHIYMRTKDCNDMNRNFMYLFV